MQKEGNDYNSSIATMLRTLAEYLEMADGNVKVRVGVQFKLKGRPIVRIPVLPVDKFSAKLGEWASGEIIKTVKRYQQETGRTDGDDLIAQFTQAQEFMRGVDKRA